MAMRISKDKIDMDDKVLQKPVFKDFGETVVTANTGSSYTINLQSGNIFNLTLTASCSFTFSNPPASGTVGSFTLYLTQDATGSRTATWPGAVKWEGGIAPTLSTTAESVDVLTFFTVNGGTSWIGMLSNSYASIPLEFTFFDSNTSINSSTVSLPASTQADDVAILFDYGVVTGSVTPSGFTSAHTYYLSNIGLDVSYKKLVGGESTITGLVPLGYGMVKIVLVFRPNQTYSTLTHGSWTSNYGGAGTPTNRTISASGQTEPVIALGMKGGDDNSLILTGSPVFSATVSRNDTAGGAPDMLTGYTIYNTSPSNVTVSTGDDGSMNMLAAGYLRAAI